MRANSCIWKRAACHQTCSPILAEESKYSLNKKREGKHRMRLAPGEKTNCFSCWCGGSAVWVMPLFLILKMSWYQLKKAIPITLFNTELLSLFVIWSPGFHLWLGVWSSPHYAMFFSTLISSLYCQKAVQVKMTDLWYVCNCGNYKFESVRAGKHCTSRWGWSMLYVIVLKTFNCYQQLKVVGTDLSDCVLKSADSWPASALS